jgi:hypothetical protein
MRSAEEMDQADVELRETILKIWPYSVKDKIELLVPTTKGSWSRNSRLNRYYKDSLGVLKKGEER